MGDPIEVRPLRSLEEVRAASELFDRIWQERRVMGAPLLRAMAAHGGQVLGAFDGEDLMGALVGLVGLTEDARPVLHSHITGVAPEAQHRGVGFLLKRAQRDWSLTRGIDVITWTFDPMVARNARFNLQKLGAVAEAFHRDYYGPMDDAFNRGDRSDRLQIRWELRSDRVERAMTGGLPEPELRQAGVVVDVGGHFRDMDRPQLLIRVPRDYHALRQADSDAAAKWRDAVADALEGCFARGYRATGFSGEAEAYVLERR
jgi:predicted GNAT superfamily acetyltransferase